uniref:JmjC domain-containing protein n=1 Tax=Pyrodinium bahamense TaxID=73915 RepID=A0A7S0A3G8_9DINO
MASQGRRQLLHVQPGDDHITAICKVSMYTEMITSSDLDGKNSLPMPGPFNLDTMDPVSTEDRVRAYVQACREVYEGLDKDGPQRRILDGLVPEQKVNVTTPYRLPLSHDLIVGARNHRNRVASERPGHAHRWKPLEEIGEHGRFYGRTKIRPVVEEVIDPSEIGEAVRQGKVARFDAVKLLGKEIFNITMPRVAELHGEAARAIPMYRQRGATAPGRSGMETLETYAQKVRLWKKANAIRFPENKPWFPQSMTAQDVQDYKDAHKEPTWWLEALVSTLSFIAGAPLKEWNRQARSGVLQCAVNTRRLPNLPMPKIEDALGNPDWLERVWSMFWLGPIGDCWHYDDPDNLLIGIYGDIWVTVFEHADREVMRAGGDRGCWSLVPPMPKRIDQEHTELTDGWLAGFPFIQFKLEPGMGVVVPSGTFHSLTMSDGDRILLNSFMMPKYKGLWDAPAAKHSFYGPRWQSEEYAAMSHLKKSAIYRLWDTRKLGGYFEGAKLEML